MKPTASQNRFVADAVTALPAPAAGARGRKAAATQVEVNRDRYHITEPGLRSQPRDLGQLRDWRNCQRAFDRLNPRAADRHLDQDFEGGPVDVDVTALSERTGDHT